MNILFINQVSKTSHNILQKMDLFNLPVGKYNLTDGIFFVIENYDTKFRNNLAYESHYKYIDIHYMLEGREIITIASIKNCKKITEYDYNKDIIFYENNLEGIDYLLTSGNFLLLYPQDAHIPSICVNNPEKIKKIVFKIPTTLIKEDNNAE